MSLGGMMIGAYVDKDFVFQVACIRGVENSLLTGANFTEMSTLRSGESIIDYLKEKKYGNTSDKDMRSLLRSEREKLWKMIDELVPDRDIFSIIRVANDYHNVKAAIKENNKNVNLDNIYIEDSNIDVDDIKDAIKLKKYQNLPYDMVLAIKDAIDIYGKTGDSQLLDVMIDKSCLDKMIEVSCESKYEPIRSYGETYVAINNIKVAVRASEMKKGLEFLKKAIATCSTLSDAKLIEAASQSVDSICSYLQNTEYKDAATHIKKSSQDFEKWCDDVLIERIKDMKYETFGIGPVLAYIIAKEQEMKTVNIIYTCINNGFSLDIIKERMRVSYV